MFDDRSKSGYDFSKIDKQARTTVITEEKKKIESNNNVSDAYKKLLSELETQKEQAKQDIKAEIIKHNSVQTPIENMPSSSYLKTFENKVIEDVTLEETLTEKPKEEEINEVDFDKLIEQTNSIEVDNSNIKKELKNIAPKPKKNFSFRIKLVAGVYCILVALFGGWVIGNAINISQTNSNIYETTHKTSEINANIIDIVSDIKQLDNASADPENETIVVKIVTEEIEITPETIIEPNEYKTSSNWFDVFCNWIASLFGGGK